MNDKELAQIAELLTDQEKRLDTLYWITDKHGKKVRFVMNDMQRKLFREQWYRNIILKARQHGFTTFIDIFLLDTCLFNSDNKAGIIAHNKEDATVIFRDKVKYPYDNLPGFIREWVSASTDRAGEFVFSNGSSIRVATSMRSGTLQQLHISEFGKIAAKYPDKAREIVTGAMEAVGQGQQVFVESTAEGQEGKFKEMCDKAQNLHKAGKKLGLLDFKFFFVAWFENPTYRTDPDLVVFAPRHRKYFEELAAKHSIKLSREQQAWYIAKESTLGDDMKREHPSIPEEAFEASIDGAYYAEAMTKLRKRGGICRVSYEEGFPVNTFWDLGMDDSMSIWFHQRIGVENRLIDYLEHSGEGLEYYARKLNERGYLYGKHYMPHDVEVKELGTGKKRRTVAEKMGIKPVVTVKRPNDQGAVAAGREEVRNFLSTCWIDEEKCDQGIKCLDGYRKEWDERLGVFKSTHLHNWACHGADSIRTGAVGFTAITTKKFQYPTSTGRWG